MSDLEAEVSDVELIERLRHGDRDATVELWTRHYPAVLLAARRVTRQPRDAEEIASDAFSGMLSAVASGAGPATSVRAYLVTSVRNLAASRARRSASSEVITDDVAVFDRPTHDTTAHMSELELVRVAFAALPRRWQIVLWRTAVDRDTNIDVGRAMDLSPNGVAALAKRARRGFRLSYLRAHLSDRGVSKECEPYIEGLADLTVSESTTPEAVSDHVASCPKCTGRLAELRSVDLNFAGLLGPAILGLVPTKVLLAAATASAPAAVSSSAGTSGHLMSYAGTKWALAALGAVGSATVAITMALGADGETPVAAPAHDLTPTSQSSVAPSVGPTSRPPARPKVSPTARPPLSPPLRPSVRPSVRSSATTTPTAPSPTATPGPSPSRAEPTPTPTGRTPTPAPTPTKPPEPTPTPTGSPTTTPAPKSPVSVWMAVHGPRRLTSTDISASAEGLTGPVRLTLDVPEGVTLIDAHGDWTTCDQSGAAITCVADSRSATTWDSTVHTDWSPSAKGRMRAVVTGTYADGSPASGSVETTWPH